MSLKDYKKMAKSQGLEGVSKELDALSNRREKDPRFWEPTKDENKRSFSIIRFLPAQLPEKPPAVRKISYWFDGPGGKYVELSPATINLPDPVKEYSKKLWNAGDEEEAKKFFPRTSYISNILVIKDVACPENEGKVWLYEYGKKIFSKIQEKIKPQYSHETKVNVFDFWAGANFKVKTCDVGGYVNYDQSEFEAPSELFDGDEELISKVYDSLYLLQPFVAPTMFKPYEELQAEFYKVMGFDEDERVSKTAKASSKKRVVEEDEGEDEEPVKKSVKNSALKPVPLDEDEIPDFSTKKAKKPPVVEEDEDEEEEEPVKKPVKKAKKEVLVEEEDEEDTPLEPEDEDEEEDEEEKPVKKPVKKAVKEEAPKKKLKPPVVEEEDEDEEEDEEEEPVKKPVKKAKKVLDDIDSDTASFFSDVDDD